MKDIELHIAALNASITNDKNFVLVLQEAQGHRRLSIIIGLQEAQFIAVALEQLQPIRPLTHDLFLNTIKLLKADLKRIKITSVTNGVYFSVIVLKDNEGQLVEVDCRTSDAIALVARQKCPILINAELFSEVAIDSGADDKFYNKKRLQLEHFSTQELYNTLADFLKKEDYESAGIVRDIISDREQN